MVAVVTYVNAKQKAARLICSPDDMSEDLSMSDLGCRPGNREGDPAGIES